MPGMRYGEVWGTFPRSDGVDSRTVRMTCAGSTTSYRITAPMQSAFNTPLHNIHPMRFSSRRTKEPERCMLYGAATPEEEEEEPRRRRRKRNFKSFSSSAYSSLLLLHLALRRSGSERISLRPGNTAINSPHIGMCTTLGERGKIIRFQTTIKWPTKRKHKEIYTSMYGCKTIPNT